MEKTNRNLTLSAMFMAIGLAVHHCPVSFSDCGHDCGKTCMGSGSGSASWAQRQRIYLADVFVGRIPEFDTGNYNSADSDSGHYAGIESYRSCYIPQIESEGGEG